MQTELTKDTDERLIEQMIKGHPLKRLLTIGTNTPSTRNYLFGVNLTF